MAKGRAQGATASAPSAVQRMLDELQAQPRAKANNVVQLLAELEASQDPAEIKSIIQGLKLYFVDAGLDGLLKPVVAAAAPAQQQGSDASAAPAPDAQAIYRGWLQRQHQRFTSLLLRTLRSGEARHGAPSASSAPDASAAGVQLAATTALLELARSELGPGALSHRLVLRLLGAALASRHARPEVLAALLGRYARYADLRYHVLWACKALASKHLPRASTAAAAPEAPAAPPPPAKKAKKGKGGAAEAIAAAAAEPHQQERLEEAWEEEEEEGGGGGVALLLPDLVRNLFDALAAVPPSLAGCQAGDAGGEQEAPQQQQQQQQQLRSWSGLAEAGVLAAKVDRNESARMRRKRQAEQAGAGAGQELEQQQQRAAWANAKTQKRLYSEAWLALLALPVPADLLRRVLLAVHETVIPHMMHPVMLADFLTHCLDQGGLTGMLALHGIFQLVTRHGLEYPSFYKRLYGLLTPSAFASKHRSQFFALADVFLASSLVPAYTIAAFCKRLARLALSASPAGAMLAVAFIHNSIRRHPACMVLLHKPSKPHKPHGPHDLHLDGDGDDDTQHASASAQQQQQQHGGGGKHKGKAGAQAGAEAEALQQQQAGEDPYLEEEEDPALSRAVESSLWELEALRKHYAPHVSTLCSVLERDLSDRAKTSEVDIQPLLASSYGSLFSQEAARRMKQVPIAFYPQQPSGLFGEHCSAFLQGWDLAGCAGAPASSDGGAVS